VPELEQRHPGPPVRLVERHGAFDVRVVDLPERVAVEVADGVPDL
jgi:hypothetical protein